MACTDCRPDGLVESDLRVAAGCRVGRSSRSEPTNGFVLWNAEEFRRAEVDRENRVVVKAADDCRKRAEVEQLREHTSGICG